MTDRLTIARPDDWHLHLRDGPALSAVVDATARVFGRAIVMPNLKPPVTTVAAAAAYRARILAALPAGRVFEPLMTLYLTDNTSADEIRRAAESGIVHAVKYYPAGATTNSDAGVTAIGRAYPALAAMERHDVVLCLHGEVTDAAVDVFDRERVFVDTLLGRLVRDFPGLRIVLEHVTTREAVAFVREAPPNVAATLTPQHLLYSRNAMLVGGVRPHLYCLPILKRETHRRELVAAAVSGNPKFFLGTDSAPHARPRRRRPAAAPAATAPLSRCRCTRKPSRTPARWTSWRASRASSARISTACRATPGRSRWNARPPTSPRSCRSATRAASCPFAPARPCAGACSDGGQRSPGFGAMLGTEASQTVAARRKAGRGKSGLRRAGCRVTPGRYKSPLARPMKARNRATETSRLVRESVRGG